MRAALAALLVALLLPAAASAQTFSVDSAGDEGQKVPGAASCETVAGKCTLRAAIEAANVGGVKDTIVFNATVFDGGPGSTIEPASLLPEVKVGEPVEIDGGLCGPGPCATLRPPSGLSGLTFRADSSVVKHMGVEIDGAVGIRAIASGSTDPGVEILDNFITVISTTATTNTGISLIGPIGGPGNLVEGNTIEIPADTFSWGISLRNGPNRIFGNRIEGGGCCNQGILAEAAGDPVNGNKIGGDTTASENVITGFWYSAIWLKLGEDTRNEVGRNRGDNGVSFIRFGTDTNGGIQPPTIAGALQSSVSGTAKPGAKVRLFRKAKEYDGELEGFLGEAVADGGGSWKVAFSKVPVGTFVAATQTFEGGTSQVTAAAAVAADPVPPAPSCATDPTLCPSPPPPPPDTTKPKATIKKAPKAKSKSTTAKFVFSANEKSTFKCKLDKKAFANCRSPKTYKKLKPGKHVFKLKAIDAAGNVSKVLTRKFTVLE